MRPVSEEAAVLASYSRAATMVGASRSYVFDTLGDISATLESGATSLLSNELVGQAQWYTPAQSVVTRCGCWSTRWVLRHCNSRLHCTGT
jgi:hypothetical protein